MSVLLQSFNDPVRHHAELLKYYPIAVVAAIQGYFRSRLADLIDKGEPFLSNAIVFSPQVKVDVSMAGAIAAGKLTFGQMLMHSISINSFGELVSVLSVISGQKDVLEQISRVAYPSLGKAARGKLMSDPEESWRLLGQAFEKRHILSHELATDLQLDREEIKRLLLMAQEFMQAAAEWIAQTIDPDRNLSPEERDERSLRELAGVKANSIELTKRVREGLKGVEGMEGARRAVGETFKSIAQLVSALRKSNSRVFGVFSLSEFQLRRVEMYLLSGMTASMAELATMTDIWHHFAQKRRVVGVKAKHRA